MIPIIKKELQIYKSKEEQFNHLRELLQIIVLRIIYGTGFFKNVAFTGGTALRILYDMKRFSEDLDFSLIEKRGYSLKNFARTLEKNLNHYHLEQEIKAKDKKTVHEVSIRFKSILHEMNLSPLSKQKLLIKIEIDTNPPSGGNLDLTVINKLFMFTITHFDLPSLYATKLHACFFRRYTKGRDFYDVLWYLTKKIEPNYRLLNNAIQQTHRGKIPRINKSNFQQFLIEYSSKLDFEKIRQDVERFLEDKKEQALLERQKFIRLIKSIRI